MSALLAAWAPVQLLHPASNVRHNWWSIGQAATSFLPSRQQQRRGSSRDEPRLLLCLSLTSKVHRACKKR